MDRKIIRDPYFYSVEAVVRRPLFNLSMLGFESKLDRDASREERREEENEWRRRHGVHLFLFRDADGELQRRAPRKEGQKGSPKGLTLLEWRTEAEDATYDEVSDEVSYPCRLRVKLGEGVEPSHDRLNLRRFTARPHDAALFLERPGVIAYPVERSPKGTTEFYVGMGFYILTVNERGRLVICRLYLHEERGEVVCRERVYLDTTLEFWMWEKRPGEMQVRMVSDALDRTIRDADILNTVLEFAGDIVTLWGELKTPPAERGIQTQAERRAEREAERRKARAAGKGNGAAQPEPPAPAEDEAARAEREAVARSDEEDAALDAPPEAPTQAAEGDAGEATPAAKPKKAGAKKRGVKGGGRKKAKVKPADDAGDGPAAE